MIWQLSPTPMIPTMQFTMTIVVHDANFESTFGLFRVLL